MILTATSFVDLLHHAAREVWLSGAGLLAAVRLMERRKEGRRFDPEWPVELPTLLGNLPDAIFVFDARGRIIHCNEPAERLCGRSGAQLRGLTIAGLNDLLAARDDSDRNVEDASMGVNRALGGETVHNLRRVFHRPGDGSTVEMLTSVSPIRAPSGRITGAIMLARDVTETAQLQHRLADSQRHKEIGQMAAGLAHDFSNVLDAIVQAVYLLELSERSEERHSYAEMIRHAVERGGEIIGNVRQYLRTGTGERAPVNLRDVLQEVLEFTHSLWLGKPELTVKTELQPVPAVLANAADLRRVFTNLIINALEAMPAGGQLTVGCVPAGDSVRITISDTGGGIPPQLQKQIFVPYFTTKPEGTGLGLSGAQRILHSFRGSISFQSKVGEGTTFVVQLPAAVSPEQATPVPSEKAA